MNQRTYPKAWIAYPKAWIAWTTVGLLVLAIIVSYVDRQVVAIVVDPMKRDLDLTDSQVGWLYGIFALFYALAGIPIARLADRGNRRNLIVAGIVVWSLMTMMSGLARNFVQVLLARIGVGAAEAALVPAGTSMISDLFPRERVPLAVSVFQAGSVMGSGLAFVIGGTVLQLVQTSGEPLLPFLSGLAPWQQFFIYVGLPGLLLAPLMLFVPEPTRTTDVAATSGSGLADTWRFYRHHSKLLLLHHLGFLSFSLLGFGIVFWSVSFFTRVHGMEAAAAAQIFGLIFLCIAPFGAISIAAFAGWLNRRGHVDGNLLAVMIGSGTLIPLVLLIQVVPTATLALLLYAPMMFLNASPFGLGYGSLAVIAPAHIRATVVSVFMFVLSLGMLLGPPLAGLLNQHLFPGTDGIRYSLATVALTFGSLGLLMLGLARRPYRDTMRAFEVTAPAS